MDDERIETEHSNTTTVRLDLRKDYGWTKLAVLKAFVAECEANGATDDTSVVVVHVEDKNNRNVYRPIIAATVHHEREAKLAPSDPGVEDVDDLMLLAPG